MRHTALHWELARLSTPNETPNVWFPATVPGAVQHDYANAQSWQPFEYGLNVRAYEALENDFWLYRAPLSFSLETGETASLIFKGIDYRYAIRVGGELLCSGEGMFHAERVDVTRFAGRDTFVEVLIYPSPKCGDPNVPTRDQAARCCKPAACYGWDWHPRLLTSGLWDDVCLQIENEKSVRTLDVSYRLTDDLARCTISADVETGTDCDLLIGLYYGENCLCECRATTQEHAAAVRMQLDSPKLWYPTGYGAQPLYTLAVSTLSADGTVLETRKRTFGVRRVRLVMNEGSWEVPGMPKSRADAPATFEVNGIRLFAKGTNWVNARVFPGEMDEAMYDRLLTLVQDANMNIIRVWGGGFVNKEAFFDLCDRKGLMVWQEFPLACNEYPDSDEYLGVLAQEATAIVRRLRTHPSLCLWGGGNELFNSWSGMTEQHHALRLLDSICYREDRFTPFIMTSPLNGMAHGHYINYDEKEQCEVITTLTHSHNTAYTEFGAPGMTAYEDLKCFLPPESIENCSPDDPNWLMHHGFQVWVYEGWVRKPEAEYYFGGFTDTEDLCRKTQFIQAMSYRAYFEEMRRRWPHCAMALNWCFNEPWPSAANNNLISWNEHPKPAYFAVQQALRPRMASLAAERHLWWAGEIFEGRVWMLNDSLNALDSLSVGVSYRLNGEWIPLTTVHAPALASQSNALCGSVCFRLPEDYAGTIELRLSVAGNPEMDSQYTFLCRTKAECSAVGMLNV